MKPKITIPRHILPHHPNTDPLWVLKHVMEAMKKHGYIKPAIDKLENKIKHPGKRNHTEMLAEMRKYVDFDFS